MNKIPWTHFARVKDARWHQGKGHVCLECSGPGSMHSVVQEQSNLQEFYNNGQILTLGSSWDSVLRKCLVLWAPTHPQGPALPRPPSTPVNQQVPLHQIRPTTSLPVPDVCPTRILCPTTAAPPTPTRTVKSPDWESLEILSITLEKGFYLSDDSLCADAPYPSMTGKVVVADTQRTPKERQGEQDERWAK